MKKKHKKRILTNISIMRADLPEDILEEILNLKKDRTNITDLAVLETRGNLSLVEESVGLQTCRSIDKAAGRCIIYDDLARTAHPDLITRK